MWEPMNSDTAISTKPPTATRQASRARVFADDSAVRRRKIGAMPSGLTMGNRPMKTVRKLAARAVICTSERGAPIRQI